MDDIPLPANALHAAFVLSTRPHAKMLSVDFRAATEVRHWRCERVCVHGQGYEIPHPEQYAEECSGQNWRECAGGVGG